MLRLNQQTSLFAHTKVQKSIMYAILIFGSVFYIYPLVWLILNSLKVTAQIYANPWSLPDTWMWTNYVNAWTSGNTSKYLFNSVLITGVSLVVVLIFSAMAAFALVKLRWKASKGMLLFFLIGFMVPHHATIIPLFVYFSKLDLVNSRFGLMLIYIAFGLPAAVLILSGFLRSLPREIMEAGVMDGCSMYTLFWRIVMPMSMPALMTVTILSFVSVWNELFLAIIFISDTHKLTLPVGLTRFSDLYVTDYAPMFAAIVIATVPTIFLFAIFNKKVLAGMAEGAIKG